MSAANDNGLPRTRAEAKAVGSTHYFTGKTCRNGHVEIRNTSTGRCLACDRDKALKERTENPERLAERRKKYRMENIEEERERERIRSKERYAENTEQYRAYFKAWREKNSEKERLRGRLKYRRLMEESPERVREAGRRRDARRRLTARGRIENALSAGIHRLLKRGIKAGRSWESLVGYTADELMRHLEKQFLPGMDWTNYGRGGWHIDHIIPRSAFNYETTDDIDFKRCWALENLQPLWEIDNISKGAKLSAPFQPSLALAMPA